MMRRSILTAASAAFGSSSWTAISFAQQLVPVKLMVLRRPGLAPTNQCLAPCIRGSIYDVSDLASPMDQNIIPVLKARRPVCDVIERPWKDNEPSKSAIPKGTYQGEVRTDRTKTWMNADNKAWRI